jgi:alpha-L-rhamnosidase
MAFSKKLVNGEKLTEENFKNPPKELGILPFWFWNGEMDEKEMEWQMREYKNKGIPGFFIHGRFGEKIGYLSDTWFERTKFVVDKAKEIGIDVWIYDEMNWPSGTAERQVLKKYPHLKQKYIELVALNVDGPLFTFLEATDDRYVNTGNSKPIAAFACTDKEFQTSIEKLIDLTPILSFNAVIPWEAPEGKWRLLYFLEKEVDYYIDTMNPESTNRFLEITHEGYKRAVGKDFGSVVPGFYTDEPAMHYYHVGMENFVVPWTSQMFKIFREKRGYDLKPYLPALYLDMGEITAQIRYDFWRTLTEQYSETYYKRIRDWCDENGVLFTGHLLFEEWLRLQARCEGNIFKYLKHMHIIGVDHLYPKIGTKKEPDQHVALKLGSSAAHHYGSTRLLCESMGGTYWDCTLERMKWIANWEYVLGVNLFNNHGYHYSIEGERKRDWPPSQFYHHTWWKYYDQFTNYMARLGHILSGGKHVAKLLVLYPINSIWTNYKPQERDKISNTIESNFNDLTDTLLRFHYDFDYVDEDILIDSNVKGNKIKIRDEEFEVLILPPITHIKKRTFDVIKKFVKGGGKVIADTFLPSEFLETEKNGAAESVKGLFKIDPKELLKEFEGKKKTPKIRIIENKNVYLFRSKGISKENWRKDLQKILNKCVSPDVIINNEDVFYLNRVKDNFDIYFLVNTSQNNLGKVEISFKKTGKPELWNPNTGEINPIYVYQIEKNRLKLELDFSNSESHFVIINNKKDSSHITDTNLIVEEFNGKEIKGYLTNKDKEIFVKLQNSKGSKSIKEISGKNHSPISFGEEFKISLENDNVLCISNWKMKYLSDRDELNESLLKDFHKKDFNDSGWLNITNGAWEMQIPQERDKETYPVTLLYRSSFEIDDLPKRISLLIDGFSGESYKLFINGKEVNDKGKRSKLDAEIKEINLKDFVVEGINIVAVQLIAKRRTDGILDLLKIVGDFSLSQFENNYKISAPKEKLKIGDWTKQGYPFYSGTVNYAAQVDIDEKYIGGKLFLDVDCGEDVLEVKVNGNKIIVPWHPYKVDISDLVNPGKNKFELKVTNTLINILEGVQKKSGIFKQPKILYANRYSLKIA